MKPILLVLCLVLNISAFSQINKVSRRMVVSIWNPNQSKWVEKNNRTTDNYISWKDGTITIVCQDCEREKFVLTVRGIDKEDEDLGDGFLLDTYTAILVPEGKTKTVFLGYKDGKLFNISIADDNLMVIYGTLEDY